MTCVKDYRRARGREKCLYATEVKSIGIIWYINRENARIKKISSLLISFVKEAPYINGDGILSDDSIPHMYARREPVQAEIDRRRGGYTLKLEILNWNGRRVGGLLLKTGANKSVSRTYIFHGYLMGCPWLTPNLGGRAVSLAESLFAQKGVGVNINSSCLKREGFNSEPTPIPP